MRPGGALLTVICVTVAVANCMAQFLDYEERCQVEWIRNGTEEVDQCDGTKLLSCTEGRCRCSHPADLVYATFTELAARGRRRKRSNGRSGGVVGKFVTEMVKGAAKKVVKNLFTEDDDDDEELKSPWVYLHFPSCYSRVGGRCVLDFRYWKTVENDTNGKNVNESLSTSKGNGPRKLEIYRIPRCVQHATCEPPVPPTESEETSEESTEFTEDTTFDPRIGVCECEPGYEKNKKDMCVIVSGTRKTAGTGASVVAVILLVGAVLIQY